jgi:uridine kinase
VRFAKENPGEHFYRFGFRFDELFESLILPLKHSRSIVLEAPAVEELSTEFFTLRYEYSDVDVIVLEGVFLLQPSFRKHYDLTVWIDCSFETAIERAILRGQEGLPPDETVEAFERIYWPAERFHFERDHPKESADLIVINDPRLEQPAD